jgi:ribonuclease-3
MEEEPVMAAPDLDKLENPDFIVEQPKEPAEPVVSDAVTQHQTNLDDELTLDDITATPREKSREEIIAEAEAAAFQDS